jgi:hypothetical protein
MKKNKRKNWSKYPSATDQSFQEGLEKDHFIRIKI